MVMTNERKGELEVSCFPPDRVSSEFFMIEGLLRSSYRETDAAVSPSEGDRRPSEKNLLLKNNLERF